MKRVVVEEFGGPEVLKVVDEEDPRPGPGEVRVRVLAAGVSFILARVWELTDDGVDVVLDGIGGFVSLRSFRALRGGDPLVGDPGGRLVVMGNYKRWCAAAKAGGGGSSGTRRPRSRGSGASSRPAGE